MLYLHNNKTPLTIEFWLPKLDLFKETFESEIPKKLVMGDFIQSLGLLKAKKIYFK